MTRFALAVGWAFMGALMLAGCGGDVPTPTPTPTPAPTPAPTPTPIAECRVRMQPAPPIVPEIPKPNTGDPMVRAAYIIPSDRSPQPYGVVHLQQAIRMIHEFYGEQLARWGFGYKTFRYEMEPGSTTPKVYVIQTNRTAAWMIGSDNGYDLVGNARQAAYEAGAECIYSDKEIWICIPETHIQSPDSSIRGTAWLGGWMSNTGLGIANGHAFVGSDVLSFYCLETCEDDRSLVGRTIPEIGPYALTAEAYGGSYSERCSGATSGLAHELGHTFGLGHDKRPDWADLMEYGKYRGWRFPEKYSDKIRLDRADAMILGISPYFAVHTNGRPAPYTGRDVTPPTVNVLSSGVQSDGLMHVRFTARDDSGVVAAFLHLGGTMVAAVDELDLSGTSTTAEFATPYYGSPWFEPGKANDYGLFVRDPFGNMGEQAFSVDLGPVANRAPEPRATTSPGVEARVNQSVTFDAGESADHDGDTDLQYEWDLDGDGIYEIGPRSSATYSATFPAPGVRQVRARVTDSKGARSSTVSIALRITADCNGNGVADSRDILDGTSADANGDWVPDECH